MVTDTPGLADDVSLGWVLHLNLNLHSAVGGLVPDHVNLGCGLRGPLLCVGHGLLLSLSLQLAVAVLRTLLGLALQRLRRHRDSFAIERLGRQDLHSLAVCL